MIREMYLHLGIPERAIERAERAQRRIAPVFERIEAIRELNQLRVLEAMRHARVSESAFGGSTGYGYDDRGREALESAYAEVFGTEAALVRPQIAAGTQAIAMCLFGVLRPGDLLLSVTGKPYDTLDSVISPSPGGLAGSLADFGVRYAQIELRDDGSLDLEAVVLALGARPAMLYVQKSRGYSGRRSLRTREIGALVSRLRAAGSSAVVLVDNCYGEFVETEEPGSVGADLMAGSLIKNPGGGLCPTGGYVAGRRALVERAASRLTAPGIGSHIGPTLGLSRLMAQGFYLAPHIVAECLKGAAFAAAYFEDVGLVADPGPFEKRGDIIQTLTLGDEKAMVRFCRAVQSMSPVDSFVSPEPWDMPGYADPVVMAAGTFIQGASLELSADGPVRPPYRVFLQGGLVYEQVKAAVMLAAPV
jgi:cystathionine beta-lyase family protein involved in aluminum resistance